MIAATPMLIASTVTMVRPLRRKRFLKITTSSSVKRETSSQVPSTQKLIVHTLIIVSLQRIVQRRLSMEDGRIEQRQLDILLADQHGNLCTSQDDTLRSTRGQIVNDGYIPGARCVADLRQCC